MYLDKQDAINLAANARSAIYKLQQWTPDAFDMEEEREEINNTISDLEESLEKLNKAIEDCPTKIKDEDGNWI